MKLKDFGRRITVRILGFDLKILGSGYVVQDQGSRVDGKYLMGCKLRFRFRCVTCRVQGLKSKRWQGLTR